MEGYLSKIPVSNGNNSKEERSIDGYIVKLAALLSRLRAVVPTWQTRDTQGSDYAYDLCVIEDPYRAITQLKPRLKKSIDKLHEGVTRVVANSELEQLRSKAKTKSEKLTSTKNSRNPPCNATTRK